MSVADRSGSLPDRFLLPPAKQPWIGSVPNAPGDALGYVLSGKIYAARIYP